MEWRNLHLERKSFHALPDYQCLGAMQRFATNDSWNVLLDISTLKEIGFCLEDTQENIKNKMNALANRLPSLFLMLVL